MIPFLKTALMFSLLIGFGSVFSVFDPLSADLLTLLLLFILLLSSKKFKVSKKLFSVLFCIYGITLLSALLTHSSLVDYAGIYLRTTIVVFIITAFGNNYEEITRYFIRALWFLTYLSLANFVLTLIAHPLFTEVYSSNGFRVYTIGYVFNYLATTQILNFQLIRNQAIFWEPGILQIPLNILISYLIIEKEESLKKALLPIFMLVTTGSTTGFIILMFILLIRFVKSISLKKLKWLHVICMLVIITLFTPILITEIHRKFKSEEGKFSSTARLYDMYISFNVIMAHPFTGVGMAQESYFNAIVGESVQIDGEYVSKERGNTNTILSMFIKFGTPLALILLYGLYHQNLFRQRFIFFVILFISLMSEPLLVVYLTILFIMSSVKLTSSLENIRC